MSADYHIPINSFYVRFIRIRYSCEDYLKVHLKYFYKTSGALFAEEKSVKIKRNVMKYWEIWK